ncbi:hypothetical protein BC830DRAFT_1163937 [Chytriomyces sp. MP71]|nr:hypothetical protein BC830DRAFT_1163937 [Chytriomyces sp. MP71]
MSATPASPASLASLAAHLPSVSRREGSVIAVLDDIRSDSFAAVHHFAHSSSRLDDSATVLLLSDGTASHFEHVAKKLGYATRLGSRQRILFVDAFSHMASLGTGNPTGPFARDPAHPLASLLAEIKHTFANYPGASAGTSLNLIIDDVSTFLGIGIPLRDVIQFSVDCRDLVQNSRGNLILASHSDIALPDFEYLNSYLGDMASAIVKVKGLDSGYTDGATGQVLSHIAELGNQEET